jgi:hypothetical protein
MAMSAICQQLYIRRLYLAQFSFGEEHIGLAFVKILHMHVQE